MSRKDEENTFSSGMPPYPNTPNKELSISPKIHCKQQFAFETQVPLRVKINAFFNVSEDEVHPLDTSQRNDPLPTNSTLPGTSEAKQSVSVVTANLQ